MALSFLFLTLSLLLSSASAAIREYNFTVGWLITNPDGQFLRPTIGINGQWPIPRIEADVGDRIIINVKNDLGNQTTSLHFHGLYQIGTNHMDGVGGVTQCPIPPGFTFQYDFNITQPGTYWYHSHVNGQYPDGLRGPLIVHDPKNPYADLYDEELVLTLSDWYHDQMPGLIKKFMSVTNPTGAEPVPQAPLMNDKQNDTIAVEPGKTYFLRIVNMGAFAAQYFWIEGHTFRIIEVDGIYTEPTEASMLYVTSAQRYGVLLTTKNETDSNFAIVGSMDQDLFDAIPKGLNPNVTSYLVYDDSKPLPTPKEIESFEPFDDFGLVPTDGEELYEDPDLVVQLDVVMDNLGDGKNYAFFSGITYVPPKVPSLYTALTTGDLAAHPSIYGPNTHSYVLSHNQTVEIVLNNQDSGKHPFHFHGHVFQTIVRSEDEAGDYDSALVLNGTVDLPRVPMRRDTILVRPNGHVVMRFKANNPGVWLFHCHIEWHIESGLIMTFVESPLTLQHQLADKIPANHWAACAANDPPYLVAGNAAGLTENLLDVSEAPAPHAPLPDGFTTKGIVAMTFSILAGLLGIATVAWYGMGEMGTIEKEKEKAKIARLTSAVIGAGEQEHHAKEAAASIVVGNGHDQTSYGTRDTTAPHTASGGNGGD
ncbi:hypothetical protein HRR83_002491 [Exophiala dermatitidis]|uniref:Ferrooxidoreductase Fet3 n=1 Tax=Exophiala dermatitidis TaxID=5970 RepID=A0AAN6IVS3_EXODE|nr:hypothetical protein HRR75_002352 [Exophiala dermatitidis]KAJ4524370.1 hypothetical protein HRR74_002568 [Exophiala dermatitidis]KAJ4525358.1 hypothetical protein HRR73_002087 [Exophiala dermatitidis]KAJ4536670.1 hypothetical protein HRR76_004699 [Exophiala dermatitidis]KAJ4555725.1 hypothetical protein HRR77_001654 [Exophiala dermatitidis]